MSNFCRMFLLCDSTVLGLKHIFSPILLLDNPCATSKITSFSLSEIISRTCFFGSYSIIDFTITEETSELKNCLPAAIVFIASTKSDAPDSLRT